MARLDLSMGSTLPNGYSILKVNDVEYKEERGILELTISNEKDNTEKIAFFLDSKKSNKVLNPDGSVQVNEYGEARYETVYVPNPKVYTIVAKLARALQAIGANQEAVETEAFLGKYFIARVCHNAGKQPGVVYTNIDSFGTANGFEDASAIKVVADANVGERKRLELAAKQAVLYKQSNTAFPEVATLNFPNDDDLPF